MTRYAVDIHRPDGTYWRTVHLWAESADRALARGAHWIARELRNPAYTARNAREDRGR